MSPPPSYPLSPPPSDPMSPARGTQLVGDDLVATVPASTRAEGVELCVLPGGDPARERRCGLAPDGEGWWHGRIGGVAPGDHYGLRVHGPWDPRRGSRANPAKLLVDPWAVRVEGRVTSLAAARAHDGDPFGSGCSGVDSAPHVPHAVVPAPSPSGPPRPSRPDVPWPDTVLYETHVRDLTMRHPDVPPELRGTYLGLAHPAVLAHLTGLGVTTVELLPAFAIADEPGLLARGRSNHWGYSTLAYLAPHPRYAAVPGAEVEEFAALVDALHAAGLELVLDVVFNHTCEGGADGPSLSWRGLDAAGWYVLDRDGRDVDLTGCGNTLDPASPLVQALVLDSLRHWASEMGVDGFRFDLASALGRPHGGAFHPSSPLLAAIVDDPVLSATKLIAEPWDATAEGYRVGGFAPGWAEWNGRFRDGVRDFWRGVGPVSDVVTRLAGSSDLYRPGRPPTSSVNFVTAHDGFTLRDLVSYAHKHNEANGEDNRDGADDNRSDNHGAEGPTSDPAVLARRDRTVRNLLATLLLSAGTPMLLGGDELGHTQGGNNNTYCLDDETSWRAWDAPDLVGFVARVLALRRETPALRRSDFFHGRGEGDDVRASGATGGVAIPDIAWLDPAARELGASDWHEHRTTLVVRVDGAPALLLVLHAGDDPVDVNLPTAFGDTRFVPALDSGAPDGAPSPASLVTAEAWAGGGLLAGTTLSVPPRTFLALRTI